MKSNDSGPRPLDPDLIIDVDLILALIAKRQRLITMAGPAGSGKTERIAHVIRRFDGVVCAAAYMGQAVRMLQRRGIIATTIHALIYTARGKNHKEIDSIIASIRKLERSNKSSVGLYENLSRLRAPAFVLNPASPLADADLLIVDEAGMCAPRLGRDLESFEKTILIVGDPHQLGPVYGNGYYDLRNPDVRRTKIYRQGEGSGILTFATSIREGWKASRAEIESDVTIGEVSCLKPAQLLRHLLRADGL
jgi:exodeoxyribonuclease-5